MSLKRYKYVGKERDEETGLYYYGARYYSAWLARFISVDPLQHKYPYYTPYQYAGNKPITFIDLDGREEDIVIFGTDGIKVYNKTRDEEAYNNAKKSLFLAFTSEKETSRYQWESGYDQYSLGYRGEDKGWYGHEDGTLVINTIGDKIQLGYTEPQRFENTTTKESLKIAKHALYVFFINPDSNVEGSEKFQKTVLGYFAMVGGAFAAPTLLGSSVSGAISTKFWVSKGLINAGLQAAFNKGNIDYFDVDVGMVTVPGAYAFLSGTIDINYTDEGWSMRTINGGKGTKETIIESSLSFTIGGASNSVMSYLNPLLKDPISKTMMNVTVSLPSETLVNGLGEYIKDKNKCLRKQ